MIFVVYILKEKIIMKKSKIIIPALGLIALGTAASITGTVAWFSMNNSVTATGMQVNVKSDSIYLLIGSGDADTVGEIQLANTTTTVLTVAAGDSSLFPSAHEAIANTSDATATTVDQGYYLTATPATQITAAAYGELDAEAKANYTAYGTSTNWYYRTADAPTASASTKVKHYLASLDTNYIIHKTCYVTLASGSNPAANLKVTHSDWAATNVKSGAEETYAAAKCLITTSSASVELDSGHTSSDTVLATSVTNAAVVQVDIFIYYDGNDESVYTNNIANLEGATIDLTFSVEAV